MSYFGPEDLAELQGVAQDTEALAMIIKVLDRVLQRLHMKVVEDALTHIPEVVAHLVRFQHAFEFVKEAFIKANPDMEDKMDILLSYVPQYESDNPGKTPEEILNLIAKDLRHEKRAGDLAIKITEGQNAAPRKPTKEELTSLVEGFDETTS